jgi:hypothetical protein
MKAKKPAVFFAAIILLLLSAQTPLFARNIGDILGNVLHSDIVAYINNHAIPTSITDGKTMVVAEDLRNYGFDVEWDGVNRALYINPGRNAYTPLPVAPSAMPVGTFKTHYLHSDIRIFLSGEQVEGFSIDGRMLIDFELLERYGTIVWDGTARSLSLTTRGGHASTAPQAAAPQAAAPQAHNVSYNNIFRHYEWYVDQGLTGASDCGPAAAVMAAKWVDGSFNKTARDIRNEFTPGNTGWWYTNNIRDFFTAYGIAYSQVRNVTTEKLVDELNKGNIIILCINTALLPRNLDGESRVGRFYSYADGHFLIVKGYVTGLDGQLYFETYDPNSWGATYIDGTLKGKDRLFLHSELVNSAVRWWDNMIVIYNPLHGRVSLPANLPMAAVAA